MPRGGRLLLGAHLGLGYMGAESGPIVCSGCNYSPITLGGSLHIGGMLNDRLGLMLELQANGETVDEVGPYRELVTLVQSAAMFAVQYWVTPQFWLKGGIGAAHLSFSYEFGGESPVDDGIALLLAGGYELISAPLWSLDLQGRLFIGSYDGIGDRITSGTIGVGFNWF